MDLATWMPPELFGFASKDIIALFNVILIDLVLAGDNAIVVGMAASRVDPSIRKKVIFWGMTGAVGLRILFALVTTHLLAIVGLTLAGGILLLWVCWKMYREVVNPHADQLAAVEAISAGTAGGAGSMSAGTAATGAVAAMSFSAAIWQIILADVSMSLDNVLAVAGAAKGNMTILVIGLTVAILMMAIAANYIAKLLATYPGITWVGLIIIVYVALDMIWRGSHEVACQAAGGSGFWCNHNLLDFLKAHAGMM